ncbi:MAG: FHA domain-containing protein [Anaerolineales bacterium]|nr:FHA domain-containing protein [Anaerolineales bacterium]
MTLHLFLGRDLRDLPHDFVFHQENEGIHRICAYLWERLQQQNATYALVAAVQRTGTYREVTPDAVLISELGIGVLELKHHYGEIDCRSRTDAWYYANHRRIEMDKKRGEDADYKNPYQQVLSYTTQIIEDLQHPASTTWLPGGPEDWANFKLQGAVCFTNPQASLHLCKRLLDPLYRAVTDPVIRTQQGPADRQMVFDILSPAETPNWAFNLRLDANRGHAEWYAPFRFSPEEVLRLARDFFGGSPWPEMTTMLHAARPPLGYLVLTEGERDLQYYPIIHEEMLIGRSPEVCGVVIPDRYTSVSRRQARLVFTSDGFYLSDEGSLHGTFVNNVRLRGQLLINNPLQKIRLGGAEPGQPVCMLRFQPSLEPNDGEIPDWKKETI